MYLAGIVHADLMLAITHKIIALVTQIKELFVTSRNDGLTTAARSGHGVAIDVGDIDVRIGVSMRIRAGEAVVALDLSSPEINGPPPLPTVMRPAQPKGATTCVDVAKVPVVWLMSRSCEAMVVGPPVAGE